MFSIILGAGLWNDSIIVVMTQVFSAYTCPEYGVYEDGVCHNSIDPIRDNFDVKTTY